MEAVLTPAFLTALAALVVSCGTALAGRRKAQQDSVRLELETHTSEQTMEHQLRDELREDMARQRAYFLEREHAFLARITELEVLVAALRDRVTGIEQANGHDTAH
jgi:outer membrane lipopolysaccharide assembly protein LptE/RlpB